MKIIAILLAAIALTSCTTTQRGQAVQTAGETLTIIGKSMQTGK